MTEEIHDAKARAAEKAKAKAAAEKRRAADAGETDPNAITQVTARRRLTQRVSGGQGRRRYEKSIRRYPPHEGGSPFSIRAKDFSKRNMRLLSDVDEEEEEYGLPDAEAKEEEAKGKRDAAAAKADANKAKQAEDTPI